jgi:hypothetical protein
VLVRRRGREDVQRGTEVGIGCRREPGTQVGGLHEAGTAPGRHVVAGPAERAAEVRHRDVPLTAAGGRVSAHHAHHPAADEVSSERDVDGGAVERPSDGEADPWNHSPIASSAVGPSRSAPAARVRTVSSSWV